MESSCFCIQIIGSYIRRNNIFNCQIATLRICYWKFFCCFSALEFWSSIRLTCIRLCSTCHLTKNVNNTINLVNTRFTIYQLTTRIFRKIPNSRNNWGLVCYTSIQRLRQDFSCTVFYVRSNCFDWFLGFFFRFSLIFKVLVSWCYSCLCFCHCVSMNNRAVCDCSSQNNVCNDCRS
ncbi:Uncharacterised protein [Streptococcus suis]|uniref:Uncharacterized protein n=1 Tax=Streptococcus suis TaxID=1307 RepID=A0A116QTF8_STRSU|nr:Uncharacterised protein [Streptococcus suis]